MNRGCVPSKALLAASGRVREMQDAAHLKQLGIHVRKSLLHAIVFLQKSIRMDPLNYFLHRRGSRGAGFHGERSPHVPQVGAVSYDRDGVAAHAKNLVANVRGNLRRSLEGVGVVRILRGERSTVCSPRGSDFEGSSCVPSNRRRS